MYMQKNDTDHFSGASNADALSTKQQPIDPVAEPARATLTEAEMLAELRQLAGSECLPQFLRLRQELLDWNTRVNLTAITNPVEVLLKHFLDSLSLLEVSDVKQARMLDIGAGAGFPGLPLKLARPQWEIVLLEATGKKVAFQRHIIATLGLSAIEAVHGRAEEIAHQPAYRASFDLVTARAVASLPALLEYAAPFCRVGGRILLPKKGDLANELEQGKRAASTLGLVFKADQRVTVPGLDDGRRILIWEQVKLCPPQYPRSGSVMSKKPLG
jgi:16S rRNA (guanine527-N7)-methyltransferase